MRAKIADFGLSKIKHTTATMTAGAMGSPLWMAPELFDDGACSQASDVYATGIVLWEIAARKLPYEDKKNQVQMVRYVEKGGRETIPVDTPSKYAALITKCWAQRVEDRPAMSEVVNEMRAIQGGTTSGKTATPPPNVFSGYQAFSTR